MHTFSATLKTAGSQSITASDTVVPSGAGTQAGITVNPAAASRFTVAGFPSPVTAGVAGSFTVTAWDPYGNRATGYTGTVRFTSSDAKAVLPGNYTFTAADAGMHTFQARAQDGRHAVPDRHGHRQRRDRRHSVRHGQPGGGEPAGLLSAPASVKANAEHFSLTVSPMRRPCVRHHVVTELTGPHDAQFTASWRTYEPAGKRCCDHAQNVRRSTGQTTQGRTHLSTAWCCKKKGKRDVTGLIADIRWSPAWHLHVQTC